MIGRMEKPLIVEHCAVSKSLRIDFSASWLIQPQPVKTIKWNVQGNISSSSHSFYTNIFRVVAKSIARVE